MPETALVGSRRMLPALKGHGGASWHRWRYPFTRRTPLLIETDYNPTTLAAERRILNPRPILWLVALILLAIIPPVFGNNSFIAAATTFGMYAAINVVWQLQIGTAGIFSLASFATVGVGAYGTAVLSVYLGFPWWAMWLSGPLFGLVFGVFIAIPAIRLEGFYYALLTVGISELCRVYVVQSQPLGAANGGLFGADGFVPDWMHERAGLILGYYAALVLMIGGLTMYRMVNGQRLGRLLRAAPEKHEAFAEALGINYRAARIQVFLISSAALGGVGGFYATLLHGASPSLFMIDQLLLLLAMVVIGGIGTTEGAVLGTAIVVLIDKVFIGLGPSRLILIAGIMLITVLFPRNSARGAGKEKASAGACSPAREAKSCPTKRPRSQTSNRSLSDGSMRTCAANSSCSSTTRSSRSTGPPAASDAATRWSGCWPSSGAPRPPTNTRCSR